MQSNTNNTNDPAPITEAELTNLESNSAFLAGVNLPDAKDEMLKITNRLIAEVRRKEKKMEEEHKKEESKMTVEELNDSYDEDNDRMVTLNGRLRYFPRVAE